MERSIPSRLILALLLLVPVYSFPQAGTPPKDTPPPAQTPPSPGSGKSSGGVSTGVSVDVGQVLHQIFKKKHKVKLEATPAQVQAGQPVTVDASVSPAKPELQYVFQWSQDSPGEQKDASTASHTYSSPGQYKVRVAVYEKGKKLATSDELAITVLPATPPSAVAAGTVAASKPGTPTLEAKTTPPAAEPAVTPAPPQPAPAKAADETHAPQATSSTPQPEIPKPSPASAKAAPVARSGKNSLPVVAPSGKQPATSIDARVLGAAAAPQDSTSSLHANGRAEAGKPGLWARIWIWPVTAILLILLAASYSLHRWRKAARGSVAARVDAGRHTVHAEGPIADVPLRIRCVPSAVRSTVTIASADNKKEAAHA